MHTEFDLQLDSFFLYCEGKKLSRKTIKAYEQTLKLFQLYMMEQHSIDDASRAKTSHIRAYIKYLRERGKYTVMNTRVDFKPFNGVNRTDYKKTVSDTTIANYTRNMKVFFNFLVDEREIEFSPMDKVPIVKPKRKQKRLLSREELKILFMNFDLTKYHEYRTYMQMKLILDTGLRATECCSISTADIDFRSRSILVLNAKGGKERFVFFGTRIARELKRWIDYKERYLDSELIFPTNRGTELKVSNFERTVKIVGNRAGIDVTPHLLRNNFAKYYLIEGGGDFATLSRILGHSDVEVTMKAYLDFTDKEVGKKYQKHSPVNNLDL